ncbi:MAG TPA: ferritin-like domain-containing protein [Verrucomicrobiae bacterium]|nr:ferritin-like domain-containing protein [Verrucomicrobiae bacterium]
MNKDRSEIVEDLNRLMAEEVEAFLRYFQMKYRLRGVDRLAAEKLFEEGTRETLEHAEAIAKQIRVLGHSPQLKIELDLRAGPTNLQDALAEMLEVERQALDAYKEVLPRVAGDTMLEDFIRKQINVETEHVQEIATLLE